MDRLKRVQRQAMKMIKGMENPPKEERLKELFFCHSREKKLWGYHITVLLYFKGNYKEDRGSIC